MKKLFLLYILFIVFSINAQNPDPIFGNWVFTKALNKGIDEAGKKFLEAEVIGKWKFNFKSDGKFDTNMMGEIASGTWKFDETSKSIIITEIEGETQKFKVLKSTPNELILKLGLGEFILKKLE